MKKFIIVTDSSCNLEESFRKQFDIEYLSLLYVLDGKTYEADLDWKTISAKEYYELIRQGNVIKTAQITQVTYKQAFENWIKQGYDVLYVGCSSSISASIKSSYVVRDELKKEYPEAKVICVDSLRACYALGLLVIRAAELRAEGKTIEEVAAWLEENKLTANMEGSVDKLVYLKRAGRVSAASAFFGGLLNIKPIIMADARGANFAVEKVKGRRTSLERVAERVAATIEDVPYQRVIISHADCLEDAQLLKQLVCEKAGKELDVHFGWVEPAVGASVGPGMLGIYYFGKKVTVNAIEE
ncbi:MAG: DegV family protein [Clostridia bacterium]|nr:DegV family protein [Clostridia bacterium]